MKLQTALLLTLLIGQSVVSESLFAAERDRSFRRGRGHRTGNEHSERVRDIAVGQVQYGGNGCPSGTMRVAFAPDNLSFSILFDQFAAEIDGSNMGRRDAMSCDVQIPLEIPQGMSMEISRVDYRGFVALPASAHAALHSVVNFRGQRGDGDRINLRYRFAGPLVENYEITTDSLNDDGHDRPESSICGGRTILRIANNLAIRSVGRRTGEQASVTIDSIDGSSNTVYYVNWKRCSPRMPAPAQGPRRFR